MKKYELCGVEVTREIFEKYADQRITIPGDSMNRMQPLRIIEIMARSMEVSAEDPEYCEKCRQIVEEYRQKIEEELHGVPVSAHETKFETFGQAIEALEKIRHDRAADRQRIEEELEEARKTFEDEQKRYSEYELETLRMNVRWKEAQQKYNDEMDRLRIAVSEEINAARESLVLQLSEFYRASGRKIDDEDEKLLNSGILLTEREIMDLMEKHKGNPTMLRLLGAWCDRHGAEFPMVRVLAARAVSGGEDELKIFDAAAGHTVAATVGAGMDAKVWTEDLYTRVVEELRADLECRVIKPE